eukprot:TRINITY_DN12300_c0_g1_i1.p3 TRINITY_DN12300_c0_g1~~TRINITY_DN12300_c0_g1_i1.p3  ORF type:complete len:124 (+),score=50.36 TRINITY_DN12300_c0_g1_i1:55-426(+)
MLRYAVRMAGRGALRAPLPVRGVRWNVTYPSDIASNMMKLDENTSLWAGEFLIVDRFNALLRSQGCNLTEDQLKALLAAMDTNKDGKISLSEFQNFVYTTDLEGGDDVQVDMDEDEKRRLASL